MIIAVRSVVIDFGLVASVGLSLVCKWSFDLALIQQYLQGVSVWTMVESK